MMIDTPLESFSEIWTIIQVHLGRDHLIIAFRVVKDEKAHSQLHVQVVRKNFRFLWCVEKDVIGDLLRELHV